MCSFFLSGALAIPAGSFRGKPQYAWFSGVECEGHESKLVECQNFGPFHHSAACEGADIGVRCGQPPECHEGSLRLEGGVTQELGRLEMCVNGVWGVVCNKDWDDRDSAVVCKELGFNSQSEN